MGQKNSAPGSERRNSRSIPPGGFSMPQPNIPPRTRRTTVSGTPAPHRQSSVNANNGTGSIGSHRRTASAAAGNRQAAYRANNIPSPPPYSPPPFAPRIPQTIPEPQIRRNNVANPGEENALDLLKGYDTVFLVDDSGSMAGALWREAGKALSDVARVAAHYDDDGIDIHFLNSREFATKVKSGEEVQALFNRVRPSGSTPTGARLDALLRPYLSSIERALEEYDSTDPDVTGIKPANYIVITDGAPTDAPEDVIIAAARRLDKWDFPLSQLGIQFVQIGSDPEAKRALEELDDELAGVYGIRDIVDTTPYKSGGLDGETLIKILLGGINRRVDRRGGASVLR